MTQPRRKGPRRATAATSRHTMAAGEAASTQVFGAAQRVIESATIAVVTSTALYLVGTVYTEAYYGRMSIEVTALDLAPPFIALQSMHAVQSLLEYPVAILVFFLLYRLIVSRLPWLQGWYERVRHRFGRLFLLLANLIIVSPLVIAAIRAGIKEGYFQTNSTLSEIAALMELLGVVLLLYVVWISFGPRALILDQVRGRKLAPIALLFAVYLLDALVATAHGAVRDAELLMTGLSDTSTAIEFTWVPSLPAPVAAEDLVFVTARNFTYFVVERQGFPPSPRPNAYSIPFESVAAARMWLINDADIELEEWIMAEATPFAR